MKQKIMVVEDDAMIRNLITLYLERANYEVITARDGEEAKALFLQEAPCLIVLDLMLPKFSGAQFCYWLKEEVNSEASIVVLSAKSETEDKVQLLRMGADGYMTKPFDPEELIAQIEAILRRTGHVCEKITHEGLTIKPKKREVWLGEENIRLTHHEFILLHHFMQHKNTVLTREALIEAVYPLDEQDISDRTIDAHIKKLRKKIENDSRKPRRIVTVRGMGYKFV